MFVTSICTYRITTTKLTKSHTMVITQVVLRHIKLTITQI